MIGTRHAKLTLSLLLGFASAFATPLNLHPHQPQPNYAAAQRLMDELSSGKTRAAQAAGTIEIIQAKGLRPTAGNVGTVLRLLVRASDTATKISLVRLLGSLYTSNDESTSNVSIVRTLKGFVYAADRNVALAAIQTYARIDYQPDRTDILNYGLQTNLLDDNAYCQELALAIPVEPASAQSADATRLLEKNNQFGAEVLALTLGSRTAIEEITPEAQKILLAFLKKQEPRMPMAIGEFGINDGGRYVFSFVRSCPSS